MPSFSFRKRSNETGNTADIVCDHGNLPAVVWAGHKEASQCKVCGKLPGIKENSLALRGHGGGNDRGVYGGKSRKKKVGKKILPELCGRRGPLGLNFGKRYATIF